MLSEHFSLRELTRSDTAVRHNLPNEPPLEIQTRLRTLAASMEAVRKVLGAPIEVTSGYRSPAVNALVGGAPSSAHVQGWAVDFRSPFGNPYEVCKAIAASGIQFDQLIHEFGAWSHISFDPRGRRQNLTISHTVGTQPGIRPL